MRILSFLLFLQALISCQHGEETAVLMTASIGAHSGPNRPQTPENKPPAPGSIVFQSTDGGQTWQDIGKGLPEKLEVREIFADRGEIYLGTGTGLYHSPAAATPKWEKANFLKAIDGIFPGRSGLYVSGYWREIFQEVVPGTGIWTPVFGSLEDKSVRTILETQSGAILIGCDTGIFRSTDKGKTWKQVVDGGIILDIVEADGVLIGGGAKGVLRSTDEGEHWQPVLDENILAKKTGRLKGRFVTILGTRDATKINPEGITSRLRVSDDAGKTWHRMEQPLFPLQGVYDMDERLSEMLDLYEIVQSGDYLFCSFNTGIFRSADQGKTWESVFPAREKEAFRMVVSGNVVYAILAPGGC